MDEDDEPDDDRPWERPGALRRDYEPHRGLILIGLGALSLGLGLISIFLFAPAVVAVLLGIQTCRMAKQDLSEMKAGRMDPAGRPVTLRAIDMARASIIVGALGIAWWAAQMLVRLWAS